MDKQSVVTYEVARQLFDYDAETGTLIWRARRYEDHPETAPAIVDMFNTNCAGKEAGSRCSQGYRQVKITLAGRSFVFKGHRLAWLLHHGEWPKQQIDHINGDRADNRISNLRDVSGFTNSRNRRRHIANKSGYWGVRWNRGAWEGKFRSGGVTYYCGRHDTKEAAWTAVRARADELGRYTERHGVAA